jgi:hypothetical protein
MTSVQKMGRTHSDPPHVPLYEVILEATSP